MELDCVKRISKRKFIAVSFSCIFLVWFQSFGLCTITHKDQRSNQRPSSDLSLPEIQKLRQKIRSLANEFHTASQQCTQMVDSTLNTLDELSEHILSLQQPQLQLVGAIAKDSVPETTRMRWWVWIFSKMGPVFQILGMLCTLYFILDIYKKFRKTQVPKLKERWNTLLQEITFDASIDYLVDFY